MDRGHACYFPNRNGKISKNESNVYKPAVHELHGDNSVRPSVFLYDFPSRIHSNWNKWVYKQKRDQELGFYSFLVIEQLEILSQITSGQ